MKPPSLVCSEGSMARKSCSGTSTSAGEAALHLGKSTLLGLQHFLFRPRHTTAQEDYTCRSSLKSSNEIFPFRSVVNAKLDFFSSSPIKYPQLCTKCNADSAKNYRLPHNKTMFQNITLTTGRKIWKQFPYVSKL